MRKKVTTEQFKTCYAETLTLRDGLGLAIDEEIALAVTVIRALGFNTTTSCSGHAARHTSGPYIVIESLAAARYAKRAYAAHDADGPSTDYQELRRKAVKASARVLVDLLELLEQFYTARPRSSGRLIAQSMPLTYICLKCQDADTRPALSRRGRLKVLSRDQAEMRAFADFLMREFVESDSM